MFDQLPTDPNVFMKWEWSDFEPYYFRLLDSTLTPENIGEWLMNWSAVSARVSETYARHSVAKSQDTTDTEAEKRFFHFMEAIYPEAAKMEQKLKEELLSSGLTPAGMEIPMRNMRQEVAIFREENLPLETEETKLRSAYDKINGMMTVMWNGQEHTMQQMEVIYLDNDRSVRERAWRASAERRLQDAEAIGANWRKLMDVRQKIAQNAGEKDYRDYRWKLLNRFDYTPKDAERFHAAIREVVVPAAERLYERRRQDLGVDKLRPSDLFVDAFRRPPLHPCDDTSLM
jgi:oligoendopeptidase F